MKDIIEFIVNGEISVSDVKEWLLSKTSPKELNHVSNYEFVPSFVNFIRENCSWCVSVSDKVIIPDDIVHSDEVSNFPSLRDQVKIKKSEQILNAVQINPKSYVKTNIVNFNIEKNAYLASKKPFALNVGCMPYQQKRKEFKIHNQSGKDSFNRDINLVSKTVNKSVLSDINNLDAFPPLGGKAVDAKVRRRITPTPVQTLSSNSSKFGKPCFSSSPNAKFQSDAFKNSEICDGNSAFQLERDLLKLTRNNLSNMSISSGVKKQTKCDDIKPKPEICVTPDPEKITLLPQLSVLVELYSFLLNEAFIPNVTSEIYFMFEIITSQVWTDQPQKDKIFSSIHNCVYFAISVLSNLNNFLYMFDKITLIALKDIPFLVKFSPQFYHLVLFSSTATESSILLPSLTRAPFQLDLDSRINFTDDNSFVSFKKQRDLFYELLREWQTQPSDFSDTKSRERFNHKVKQLISLNQSALNLFHLARLFQSQLIASCMCLEVNEIYDEFLGDIQKNFPEKFKKLQERFLMPSSVGGLIPSPTFYGIQAFYSELIISAASPSWNQHLVNAFVCKITDLNNTDIFTDEELDLLGSVKDKYIFLLHTLRLLGKFLGFLHFLPYKTGQIPAHLVNYHVESRRFILFPLNLAHMIKDSKKNNQIILTVPWIVEYLSMMDPIAKYLPQVQEVLNLLVDIYRWNNFVTEENQPIIFLRLIVGWLFGVINYPIKYSMLLQPVLFSYAIDSEKEGLDSLNVVDKQLIHSCCPYLVEFKVLVCNFMNNSRNKREVRKITPLSTNQTPILPKHQMESQLEENFFFLQPSSLKKTADFVADRVASKTISKIRHYVTSQKLSIVNEIVESEEFKFVKNSGADNNSKQQPIACIINAKTEQLNNDILQFVSKQIEDLHKDLFCVISTLLSHDTKLTVVEICSKICFRIAVNKVSTWCDSNLSLDAIKSDITSKVYHVSKGSKEVELNKDICLREWISKFRSITVKVYAGRDNVKEEYILQLCSKMTELIASDIGLLTQRTLILMSVDMYISLIVKLPDSCSILLEPFVQLWLNSPKDIFCIRLLICSQNIKLLQTSKNFELSLQQYDNVLKACLTAKLFLFNELEKHILTVMESNWCIQSLKNVLKGLLVLK